MALHNYLAKWNNSGPFWMTVSLSIMKNASCSIPFHSYHKALCAELCRDPEKKAEFWLVKILSLFLITCHLVWHNLFRALKRVETLVLVSCPHLSEGSPISWLDVSVWQEHGSYCRNEIFFVLPPYPSSLFPSFRCVLFSAICLIHSPAVSAWFKVLTSAHGEAARQ